MKCQKLNYIGPKSKKRDVLLLTGDIQPIDEQSCYLFCEEILKIVKQFKCSEIVTTGGIGLQNIPEHPNVYVTANTTKILNEYTKKELRVQKNIFGVVGPVVGVSGVLLGMGGRKKVRGASLLAETFAHPMYLGIKGAKELIRVLEKKFTWGVKVNKMSKEIVELEKEVMRRTKEWTLESSHHSSAGAKLKKQEAGYIG